MIFNEHSEIIGKHAAFGASKHSWVNYNDPNQFINSFRNSYATQIGTALHEFASDMVKTKHGKRISKGTIWYVLFKAHIPLRVLSDLDLAKIQANLSNYIGDAIGFGMETEVPLKYSNFFFGTTDAIQYFEDTKTLRIHDLKTGSSPVSMDQLMIYAALFMLEYGDYKNLNFNDIFIELRIYQSGEVIVLNSKDEKIDLNKSVFDISQKIIKANKLLTDYKNGD